MINNVLLYILIACTVLVSYITMTISIGFWMKAIKLLGWKEALLSSYHRVKFTAHQSFLARFVRLPGVSTLFFLIGILELFNRWSKDKIDAWLCLGLILMFLAFAHHAINLIPPTILLLSTSRNESDKLIWKIERSTGILPVHLLGEERYPDTESFRTPREKWEAVVHGLIDSVPIVIVDTRVITTAVLKETSWILTRGMIHKTVFVAGERQYSPVLNALLADELEHTILRLTVVTEEDLLLLLKHMTKSREKLPKPKMIPQSVDTVSMWYKYDELKSQKGLPQTTSKKTPRAMDLRLFLIPFATVTLGEFIGSSFYNDPIAGIIVGTIIGYILFMITYIRHCRDRYK